MNEDVLDSSGGDAPPVFVDTSGRRMRRLRLAVYAVGGLCAAYAGMMGFSLLGGPVSPRTLLPLPGVPGGAIVAPDTDDPDDTDDMVPAGEPAPAGPAYVKALTGPGTPDGGRSGAANPSWRDAGGDAGPARRDAAVPPPDSPSADAPPDNPSPHDPPPDDASSDNPSDKPSDNPPDESGPGSPDPENSPADEPGASEGERPVQPADSGDGGGRLGDTSTPIPSPGDSSRAPPVLDRRG